MQGNQVVELTDFEILLSAAMDLHFTNDNCDGVLIEQELTPPYLYLRYKCKNCHNIVQFGI